MRKASLVVIIIVLNIACFIGYKAYIKHELSVRTYYPGKQELNESSNIVENPAEFKKYCENNKK